MNITNLLPADKTALLSHGFVDDFEYFRYDESGSEGRWNLTADAGGSQAIDADGVGGIVTIATDGDDNDEAYIYTNEISQFVNGKPMLIVARLQFTEANTDDANVIFGVGEGFGAANTLQDDGAGPLADYDGACFFKADGNTLWSFETSDGTAQDTTELEYTAGQSGYQTLAIVVEPLTSSEMLVTPWIDQSGGNNLVQCRENGTNARCPNVQHRESYAGAGEMAICIGAKAGGANAETVNVDLVIFRQTR